MATVDMGQKEGRLLCLSGGAGSPSNTVWPGRGLLLYQVTSSSIQPFGHNGHGPKIGGCARLGEVGAGFPSNTMLPGPRSTSIPCGILMHPAVWPQ